MGTAFTPAKTSPASWDAFSNVDAFVDVVLAELAAMAADGTRSTRSGPKPPLAGAALRKAIMAIWCVAFCGLQWRAIGQLCDNPIPRKEDCLNNPASLREPPVVTHDFSAPIPAGTLRISVICNDHLHRTDLLMVKVPDTIRAFEEFIGIILSAEDGRCTPGAAKACTEITVSAAQTCDEFIVATSALWRFLFDPVEYVMNTHRLGRMAQNNGSALLAASLDLPGDHWRFQLFAMPRWPAL